MLQKDINHWRNRLSPNISSATYPLNDSEQTMTPLWASVFPAIKCNLTESLWRLNKSSCVYLAHNASLKNHGLCYFSPPRMFDLCSHGSKVVKGTSGLYLYLKLDNLEKCEREIDLGQLHHAPLTVTQRHDHRPLLLHFSTHILGEAEISSSEIWKLPLTPDKQSLEPMVPWVEDLEQDAHPLCSLWTVYGG